MGYLVKDLDIEMYRRALSIISSIILRYFRYSLGLELNTTILSIYALTKQRCLKNRRSINLYAKVGEFLKPIRTIFDYSNPLRLITTIRSLCSSIIGSQWKNPKASNTIKYFFLVISAIILSWLGSRYISRIVTMFRGCKSTTVLPFF